MTLVLVVDDDQDLAEMLGIVLTGAGIDVDLVSRGDEVLEIFRNNPPDLVLLDVMLPGLDGIEVCKLIRAESMVPIVMLSAKGDTHDVVRGLEAGADDYITKPIKPKVLVSKVKALLRRFKQKTADETHLTLGDLIINREEYKVMKGSQELSLPRKEFELLALLASKPGKVFKREDILDSVWGNDVVVGGRTIDVHIRKLREKIGDERFKTVKGVGYKFVI